MGGQDFMFARNGTDLNKVFTEAREQALYDYGHAGYTGTIAEKFEVELRAGGKVFASRVEAGVFADSDTIHNDKWGPAFAVAFGTDGKVEGFLLYGMASS